MANTFKETDCGKNGKMMEMAIKRIIGLTEKVSRQGKTDIRKARVNYEVKTGAGVLGVHGEKLLPNCSKVIYIPVVVADADADKQEGFVLTRTAFLSVLDDCGLIREKVSTDGIKVVTIQTFWNGSKNAPTSKKKYEMLLDALYENCDETLEEWLATFAR